jgi:gliding motility-associated lipoprotein GldH
MLLKHLIAIITGVFLSILFFSCEKNVAYEQYQAIESSSWGKDKRYYFTFNVDSIGVPYDISFQIRNNNLYPYQNIWLFYSIEPPVGEMVSDTTNCKLADEFGKWYGDGISLFESSFPLYKKHYFKNKGQYTFAFRHGMRDSVLNGIQEIGIKVEQSLLPSRSVKP